MAVYTHLGAERLAAIVAQYDVGALISAKGIAEGVSNSNWLIETSGADGEGCRFILTMYERRIELGDLPYFLGLLDHLSSKGCPVPRTIHDEEGAAFRMMRDPDAPEGPEKAIALIEFLPGVSPTRPTPAQASDVGAVLAAMHLASSDFPLERANRMDFATNSATLKACGRGNLSAIDAGLPTMLGPARQAAALDLETLPRAQIHADLFPDNVLMLGDRVSGLIDFYFACTGPMALDLATTHAAWCFDADNRFMAECSAALIAGYESVRPLEDRERTLMPEIAKGAALRFVASRAEDWLDTPADALVARKDPMQFAERWRFYDEHGEAVFTAARGKIQGRDEI